VILIIVYKIKFSYRKHRQMLYKLISRSENFCKPCNIAWHRTELTAKYKGIRYYDLFKKNAAILDQQMIT